MSRRTRRGPGRAWRTGPRVLRPPQATLWCPPSPPCGGVRARCPSSLSSSRSLVARPWNERPNPRAEQERVRAELHRDDPHPTRAWASHDPLPRARVSEPLLRLDPEDDFLRIGVFGGTARVSGQGRGLAPLRRGHWRIRPASAPGPRTTPSLARPPPGQSGAPDRGEDSVFMIQLIHDHPGGNVHVLPSRDRDPGSSVRIILNSVFGV